MLEVLAQRHPARYTKPQWGLLARIKHTGGTFGTYLSRLRAAGYIEESNGLFGITDSGFAAAVVRISAPAVTPAEDPDEWNRLGGSEFRFLVNAVYRRDLTPLMVFE